MADDPIVPYDCVGDQQKQEKIEADVVDLAGVRIQWGVPKNRHDRCEHKRVMYDQQDRRVWCQDCERTIDSFDAPMMMVRHFRSMNSEATHKLRQAREVLGKTARLRATKELDKIWTGNVMAVQCPHCKAGLLPEDFANGASAAWSRELELAERKRRKPQGT